jgi:hypothetical protein
MEHSREHGSFSELLPPHGVGIPMIPFFFEPEVKLER